ncbi:Dipeptidylpeptidase [Trichoderma guizhouense]|uniref:Carboxylic ester hydrolase n=1 Tax=Trichoderma guizhouense TaxID=1491466 RepID=A0A1T3CWL5_9HYPO|nr:Dipeptidylpeptidase [Trichoderma guizhouense]
MSTTVELLLGSLALASSILGNDSSLPTVDLGYQIHRAISLDETFNTYNFTNIPYAEPPLGPLRFKAPIPPRGRKSEIQDGSIGKICPQANTKWNGMGSLFAAAYATGRLPFNYTQAEETLAHSPPRAMDPRVTEDCLVLDVLVPKAVFHEQFKSKGAPVLVWIYGGGYALGDKTMFGSPHELMAATQQGENQGAIWVAMNYRLGAFGFLSGPTLQETGTANAGLHDQRLALEWVQENIHKFGGDPDNVTLMGISAGGGSVMHQITAYGGLKPALFRQAITQSSAFVPNPGTQLQEDAFNDFLSLLNVSSLEEARALDSATLIEANAKQIAEAPHGTFIFGPTVDGDFVPGVPTKLILQGSYSKGISILSSHMSHEGIFFINPRAIDDETLLRQQLRNTFPHMSKRNFDFVFDTLYPPTYDGSYPYKTPLERAELIIAEPIFICNQNSMLNSAMQQGTAAFGYQFSIPPALHGGDQPYIFPNGPFPNVDPTISKFVQQTIAGFVINGAPSEHIAGASFPPYATNKSILNLVPDSPTIIPDPTANGRCAWWHKALYS